MAAETGKQLVQQPRPVGLGVELGPKRGGAAEPVTEQGEVARTSAARGQACQGAGKVGQSLECDPDPLAAKRVLMQPGDQCEAGIDRRLVRERCGNVLAEKASPARRLAAVDLSEQASGGTSGGRA